MNISDSNIIGEIELTPPQAQRITEKDMVKTFDLGQKVSYYARRKTTWTALAGIGYALYTKDYFGAFNLIAGLF